MGGDLKPGSGKAPTFLVMAIKDPKSGNLDRIQIVKGWLDAAGKQHEKIYDVVWSGDRKVGADGKLPAGGQHASTSRPRLTRTPSAQRSSRRAGPIRTSSRAARVLLCPRHRDPDAALEYL